MSSTGTLLLAPPWPFENPQKLISDLTEAARRERLPEPYTLIQRPMRAKAIPGNTVILTDLPARIAADLPDLLAFLKTALERKTAVVCPGSFDLRPSSPTFQADKRLIEALAGHRGVVKAVRIREGLHRSRERGIRLGRQAISEEIRQQVLAEYARTGSIRGTARVLKQHGIEVSRSSVLRIVNGKVGGAA